MSKTTIRVLVQSQQGYLISTDALPFREKPFVFSFSPWPGFHRRPLTDWVGAGHKNNYQTANNWNTKQRSVCFDKPCIKPSIDHLMMD